jgi:hypothetical protein
MLPAAVVLKPVPEIVTIVPIGPEEGEKDVIVGWANRFIINRDPVKNSAHFFIRERFAVR